MRATNWEFRNRALVFGLIFALAFSAYSIDPQNSVAALANWLAAALRLDTNFIARLLFGCAAVLLVFAAIIRTWASSYLRANVVYAAEVKTESLVADGPYRHTRNPLYFANVFLALGLGAMMSRTGFFVAILAMLAFCYRLIFREEAELQANQGDAYERYRRAVPRLWPTLAPRVAPSGRQADWIAGFKAEFWYWGSAVAVAVYAVTLNPTAFLIILAGSVALLWLCTLVIQKKTQGTRPADP
ncbi:MAG: isoprenylcysteine carboxylmethyltransferase family protein [Bryobacteraceae bacterium]